MHKPDLGDSNKKFLPDAEPEQPAEPQTEAQGDVRVVCMPPVKLKRPNRVAMVFDLKKHFGFTPDKIVIRMSPTGQNNAFQVCAVDNREPVKEE